MGLIDYHSPIPRSLTFALCKMDQVSMRDRPSRFPAQNQMWIHWHAGSTTKKLSCTTKASTASFWPAGLSHTTDGGRRDRGGILEPVHTNEADEVEYNKWTRPPTTVELSGRDAPGTQSQAQSNKAELRPNHQEALLTNGTH